VTLTKCYYKVAKSDTDDEEKYEKILSSDLFIKELDMQEVLIFLFFCGFFFCFLGLHPRHMEVPRLEVKSELQLPAYSTATATPDPSCFCNLHHSSWHCQTLKPLSEARD